MIAFSNRWGGGTGWIRRQSASTRLLCGVFIFASCCAVSLDDYSGIALFAGILTGWIVWCGSPWTKLREVLLFSLCLFFPLVLLAPLIYVEKDAASWVDACRIPLVIGLRGTACIVVCAATVSVLEVSEFRQSLAGMPLPRIFVALVLQITHQTAVLEDESRRMADALRVRGVSSAAAVVRLRCLFALPVIWLLRLILRAERVGDAMDVRGFDGMSHCSARAGASSSDRCAVAVALVVFGMVLMHRWMGAA